MSDTCVRPENRYLDPQQLQHSWNLDPDAPLPSCEVENTSNSSANDWLIMLSSGRAAEACDELPGRDVEVGLEIPPLTVPSMIDATAPAPPPAFSTSSRLAWWDETNRAPAAKAESSASNDHLTGSFPSLTPTDAARFTGTTNHLSHNNYNGSRGDDLQSLPSCSFGHGASISERQPGSRKSSASDLLMDLGEIATPTSACSADFKLASKRRASVQALTQRVLQGEAHRRSNSMAMMASLAASDATMIDRGTPCDRSPSPQRSLSEQEGSFVLGRTTTGGAPPPPMIELVPGSGSTSMKGVSMASFSGMEGGRGAVPAHARTGSASNMQVYRQHLNTKKTDALRQYRDAVKFVKERRYGWTLKEILANRHRVGMEDDDDDDDEESEEGEEEDDDAPRREEPEDEMCSTPRDDAR